MQRDTLLLADVFGRFYNECIKIHEVDPARFLPTPGLTTWQVCLKEIDVSSEILTEIEMLLIVEKRIRRGTCNAVH